MRIKLKPEPSVGEGIFTIPEASMILCVSKNVIGRWVQRYWEEDFINNENLTDATYTWGEARNKAFNFYTLVEIIIVHSLRKIGVSFKKIKLAHDQLVKLLNSPYPFATSKLISDGSVIFWDYNDSVLIDLNKSLQLSFKKIIEPFCKKLDFNQDSNLAQRFWPLGKNHSIVVDPHHCFGQPTIFGTNITTNSVYRLLIAGEEKESIALIYNLQIREIEDVIKYEQRLAA